MAANQQFRKYIDDQVNGCITLEKLGNGPSNIFKLLLDHKDKETGESMEFKELSDKAVILIIAVSDTTGMALTRLFFYLARYHACYKMLQQEIRSQFTDVEGIVSRPKLLGCKYMCACVDKALYMSPGVPGFLTYKAPEGAFIN
ncbi:hypothetical protein CNMCM7691_003157 [Aspergillus felis]|uniref:Cytochrome P450 n=1 Tax=Aspergillus felis TaxID=1287682 RepID=A0A8H6R2M5_9EURO|nr:hypothetical protein CNMCM7691_003157 [Aspergillus felis]